MQKYNYSSTGVGSLRSRDDVFAVREPAAARWALDDQQ